MRIIRIKDPEKIVKFAKKYKNYNMELTIYINDPNIIAALKKNYPNIDVIKID
jgi:ssRNA-specific RNase YbeY (16S rRNA maturation enzyme)